MVLRQLFHSIPSSSDSFLPTSKQNDYQQTTSKSLIRWVNRAGIDSLKQINKCSGIIVAKKNQLIRPKNNLSQPQYKASTTTPLNHSTTCIVQIRQAEIEYIPHQRWRGFLVVEQIALTQYPYLSASKHGGYDRTAQELASFDWAKRWLNHSNPPSWFSRRSSALADPSISRWQAKATATRLLEKLQRPIQFNRTWASPARTSMHDSFQSKVVTNLETSVEALLDQDLF
jgi:hypothetical protein